MKKQWLFLIFGILFLIIIINFIKADDCQLATPRYGVVQCMNTGQQETLSESFDCSNDKCTTQISCLSNCEANIIESSLFGEGSCSIGYLRSYNIIKNGDELGAITSINWNVGDTLKVEAFCKLIGFNSFKPINNFYPNSKFSYSQDKIQIYEGWAGSLPDTPISGTEGCILNKNYETSSIESYFNPSTGQNENKPPSTYDSLSQFPKNWKIGDHFVFVKDWQTGIADISLTYDKNNKGYWCGGQYGSRTIYNVQEVTSSTGKCYSVPQSVYLNKVECCFPSDCVNNYGAEYTCNPEVWKCEQTKPCNSQLDCDQTFGEGVCQNNQINKWVCDLTKKWGNYSGTCVHSEKQVTQCPSDCSNKQYYNEEQGKCLTRTGVTEEKINSSISDSTPHSQIGSSTTGTTILIIFLILIAGAIAFFVYTKNKKNKFKKDVKKEIEKRGKHCTKCGELLRSNSKFCPKCGKKL